MKIPHPHGLTGRLLGHLGQAWAWLGRHQALTLALGATTLYSLNLGRLDLDAEEARNVLGGGAPLVHGLIVASQAFGARNEFWARFSSVLVGAAGVTLAYLTARKLTGRHRRALAAALAFGLFVPWIRAVRAADLVAPVVAGLLLAGYGLVRKQRRLVGLGLALTVALIVTSPWPKAPAAQSTLADRTWFHRNLAAVSQAIGSSASAVVLGSHGPEVQYYFPVPVLAPSADLDARLAGPVFVFRPDSLTPKEKARLSGLHFDQLIGGVAVYRAR